MRLLTILALLGLWLLAAASASAEPRVALVIGNSAYDARLGQLNNPTHDARRIAATLRQAGFSVDLTTDLDRRGMDAAIARLGARVNEAGAGTTALFFYAGHGLQYYGINYLVPIGAPIGTQEDIPLHAIAADTIVERLREATGHRSILILDACRNSPLPRLMGLPLGLAEMKAKAGSFEGGALIAYSSGPGETALDGDGGNSPYAAALSAELLKPGVPIEILFRNVRLIVKEATGNKQEPWESTKMVGEFTFVGPVAAPPRPVEARPAIPISFLRAIPIRDFATIPTGVSFDLRAPAERYLREGTIPVEIRDVSPASSEVVFFNTSQLYEGRAFTPTVSPNVLTQSGTGNGPASFTLVLPRPVARVRLLLPRLFAATESGITFPAWTATALDSAGKALDSEHRELLGSYVDVPEYFVELEASTSAGISAVRFESDPRLNGVPFAAFSAVLLEGIWIEPM
jgi:hypothetical protein